jgi:hypothetical protein
VDLSKASEVLGVGGHDVRHVGHAAVGSKGFDELVPSIVVACVHRGYQPAVNVDRLWHVRQLGYVEHA